MSYSVYRSSAEIDAQIVERSRHLIATSRELLDWSRSTVSARDGSAYAEGLIDPAQASDGTITRVDADRVSIPHSEA